MIKSACITALLLLPLALNAQAQNSDQLIDFKTLDEAYSAYKENPLKTCCSFSLSTDKSIYLPGEFLKAIFILENTSTKTAYIESNLDPDYGNIDFLISDDAINYKNYFGDMWRGIDCNCLAKPFLAGNKTRQEVIISYNRTSGNEYIDSLDNTLNTRFLLSKPGIYWIKAVFIQDFGDLGKEQIESVPLKIRVEAPQGDDLLIWDTISRDKKIFDFLTFHLTSIDEVRLVVPILEDLVEAYPKSRYVPQIKKALKEFEPFRKEYGLD